MGINRISAAGATAVSGSMPINKPTGTVNSDVLIAFILSVGAAPTTVPAGWTQLQQNNIGTPTYLTSYRKVASSEGATYTWANTSNSIAGVIVTYRGVDNTTPVSTSSAAANSASSQMNGTPITTAAANQMVIWGGATDAATRPVTITQPAAMAKVLEKIAGVFSDFADTVADAILAVAGTTGATYNNGTQTSSVANLVHMIALNPAPSHAVTSTTRFKFGSASASGFGSVRRVGTAISLGAGDFTAEVQLYWTGGAGLIFDWGAGGAGTTPQIAVDASGHILWISAGATHITSSNVLTLNTWMHVAVVRFSGVITIYINGAAGGTYSSAVTYTTTTAFVIGNDLAGANPFPGNIDEVSVSVVTAFYTANFTPPMAAFADSGTTSGSGYVLQENSSRIIVN